jgi:pimeloyl-ACP methyl ester carboxylesterase
MSKARLILGAIVVGLGAVAIAADWEREFAQGMSSPDTNVRYKVVSDVDPNDPKGREKLYGVLDKEIWHIRSAAIDALSRANDEAMAEIQKQLEKHSSPFVREGLVYALGKTRERVNGVIAALDDKADIVRRAAAISIGGNPTKEGISALMGALEKEKVFDVRVFIREALERATGQYFGWSAQDWKNWWAANKESWKPKAEAAAPPGPDELAKGEGEKKGEKSEEEKKAEEEGRKASETTTTLRDVELNFKESGKGGPLFVMPEYGLNRIYLEKHLSNLEDAARLFYIDLPEINKFKGLQNVGATGVPYYPIEKLADAFDQLRQDRKQDRIAIMGHGMSAWVAMRYATKYPKNVSHLILISTWTSGKAWDKGRARVEADGKSRKDPEQEHYAQNKVVDPSTGKHNYEPKDPQEQEALKRMDWTLMFGDPRNAFAMIWYKPAERPMGGCIIPDFDVAKEKGNPVPTLIVYGTHPRSFWTSPQDMKSLSKYYPNSEVLECPHSTQMPMIEDFDLFTKGVRAFLKKYPFRKAK